MKRNSIKIINEGYFYLNENQHFRFDKQKAESMMKNIEFPVMIFDTEFVNQSHDRTKREEKFHKKYDNKDIVFLIEYSIASSWKEMANRNNLNSIKSICLQFNYLGQKQENIDYEFDTKYKKLKKAFLNVCQKNKIRTLICAGASNDIRIVEDWIKDFKSLYTKTPLQLISTKNEKKEQKINFFDSYQILENCFSFSNTKKNGEEFYKKEHLPKGKQDTDMISLTSNKKFFSWFEDINKDVILEEEENIHIMCIKAYSFFSDLSFDTKNLTMTDFNNAKSNLVEIKNHCFNDVLMVLEFLSFSYEFAFLDFLKNSYIYKS